MSRLNFCLVKILIQTKVYSISRVYKYFSPQKKFLPR